MGIWEDRIQWHVAYWYIHGMHSSSTFIKCAASFTHDTDVQYRPSEENKYIKFKISKF